MKTKKGNSVDKTPMLTAIAIFIVVGLLLLVSFESSQQTALAIAQKAPAKQAQAAPEYGLKKTPNPGDKIKYDSKHTECCDWSARLGPNVISKSNNLMQVGAAGISNWVADHYNANKKAKEEAKKKKEAEKKKQAEEAKKAEEAAKKKK